MNLVNGVNETIRKRDRFILSGKCEVSNFLMIKNNKEFLCGTTRTWCTTQDNELFEIFAGNNVISRLRCDWTVEVAQ